MVPWFRTESLRNLMELWGMLARTKEYSRSDRYEEKHQNVSELDRLHGSQRFIH